MKRLLILSICACFAAAGFSEPASSAEAQKTKPAVKAKPEIFPAGSIVKGKLDLKSASRLFGGETIELSVTVFDTKGNPQENRKVEFSVEAKGGKGDASFGKTAVITNKKGIATVSFTADSGASVLNIVKATALGIKDVKNNFVLFRLKSWPAPLFRVAENYGMLNDWQAVRIDHARTGGAEAPEAKFLYYFKKPDKTKSVSFSDSANYSIFNNNMILTSEKDKKPKKTNCKAVMGIDFEQVNYQYSPLKFMDAHAVSSAPVKKFDLPEVYRLEAVPNASNNVYSRIVVYVEYSTGLDVYVEKYGPTKKLEAVTGIRKAKQWSLKTNTWTGLEFDLSKKFEPESAVLKTDFDLTSEAETDTVWIPVETESITYYGKPKDTKNISSIITNFEEIKVNRGLGDAEFNIP
ncbi:MAG: Ig-like domain-containing protein [Candidatus Firestonebacteria bacterium]